MPAAAWQPVTYSTGSFATRAQRRHCLSHEALASPVDDSDSTACTPHTSTPTSRRRILAVATGSLLAWTTRQPTHALVKGVAPPPPSKPASGKPKCTNIDECQALAERKEQEEREAAMANQMPVSVTASGGVRYRDLQVGTGEEARLGDEVTVYYKVLKLGKRSYDGLSGEGTVIFSRGYGLEDDEKVPGDKSFTATLGAPFNIMALNYAVAGMKEKGIRRFVVLPQQGWRKPGQACDGGPGGSGAGGDLKTDYVVVPTAIMVAEEACFDSSKQPFPVTYAQQRRMAQRFDQSLIMEVELVSTKRGGSLF